MSLNNFKGTLYDLLGYFASGLFSILAIFITFIRINKPNFIFESIKIIENISGFVLFVLIVASYIFGHVIASTSSLLLEKCLIKTIKKLNDRITLENILDNVHYDLLCNKYQIIFGAQYDDKNFRKIICFVQAKQQTIYGTALIFLSFYGMARNFALVFYLLSIIEFYMFIISIGNWYLLFSYILLFAIFLYEYIRFVQYFKDTIVSGFLVPENSK